MKTQITQGQEVTLRHALGNVVRVVVEIYNETVAVCSPEEYRRAKVERREPLSVGFKLTDIVDGGPPT